MQNKADLYRELLQQMDALTEGCRKPLPACANCSALLYERLKDINWAGFYFLKGDTLYLGPFQGKIACTQIRTGRGVCGTAVQKRSLQLVEDVHAFPGHIACDSASNSQIVIPLQKNGVMYGVLDIDSPVKARFDRQDAEGLSQLCEALMEATDWQGGLL